MSEVENERDYAELRSYIKELFTAIQNSRKPRPTHTNLAKQTGFVRQSVINYFNASVFPKFEFLYELKQTYPDLDMNMFFDIHSLSDTDSVPELPYTQRDVNHLIREKEMLFDQIEALKGHIDVLKDQNQDFKDQIATYKGQVEALKSQIKD